MDDHYDRYNSMEELLGTNLAEVGTDCISRQAAIDALNEYFARIGKLKRRGLTKGEKAISLDTVGAIKTLPPVQPKRGMWVYQNGMIKCDQCLRAIRRIDHDGLLNFCPNCGADMREVTT